MYESHEFQKTVNWCNQHKTMQNTTTGLSNGNDGNDTMHKASFHE